MMVASVLKPICRIDSADDLLAAEAHARIHRVYAYWKSIHPVSGLPGRQHIEPMALGDLLPGIWLVDVSQDPFRLRYRLVGTGVVEAMGRDTTGQWLDEAHPHLVNDDVYWQRSRDIVASKVPSWRRGPPHLWKHETYSIVENLIMPLAADGTNVDMLCILSVFYARSGEGKPRAY
jgi:hypothetical protein